MQINTNQVSIIILGLLIIVISNFFIKSILKEGKKGLEDIKKNKNQTYK